MDGKLHPGYVMNWNGTAEYQISPNNILVLSRNSINLKQR
jgi:hypothetical protein